MGTEYEYVAYIDEAGDDGLRAVKPKTIPGSSEWLILSAVVIRAKNQSLVPTWIERIRSEIHSVQARSIHFHKLQHYKKRAACMIVGDIDARLFVVASNKKNMEGYTNPDAALIPSQCWYYCWMTRLLLERVTDFVYEKSMSEFGSPRKLRIEYSARGGLSYSQMAAYYEWLKMKRKNPFLPWGKVRFEVMDGSLLKVYPHYEREGLQLADIVASAFFKACDKHDTGACDAQFAKLLSPRIARYPDKVGGQVSGYGVKLLPGLKKANLDDDQSDIFKFFGYPRQWWDPEAFSQ